MAHSETLRIVLLGKTGNGKSRTGNTILGQNVFEFSAQSQSVTQFCQKNEASRFGKHICVVDTPGVFDTRTDNAQVQEEIKRCISLTTPGPHAIILCVPIGRFSQEDIDAVNFFLHHFGESMMRYVIILFTRFDDWKRDNAEETTSQNIDGYISSLSDSLRNFLQRSSNRFIPFDNTLKGTDGENQVKNLLTIIENMVQENGGSHYTNSDYQEAEKIRIEEEERLRLKQEQDRLLQEETIRKQREEELRKEHEEKERQLQAQLAQARQEQEAAARRHRHRRRRKRFGLF